MVSGVMGKSTTLYTMHAALLHARSCAFATISSRMDSLPPPPLEHHR